MLLVSCPNGQTKAINTLNIYSNCDLLKNFINYGSNIPENYIIEYNGDVINDISQLKFKNYDHINILPSLNGGMQIIIQTLEAKNYTIETLPSETIEGLKGKLYEKSGEPPSKQKLYYKGKLLTDETTLEDAGITGGCVLNIVFKLPDSVQLKIRRKANIIVTVDAQLSNTVQELKEKIYDKIRVDPNSQCLIFRSNILDNCSKTLQELNIHDNTELNLIVSEENKIWLLYLVVGIILAIIVFEIFRFFH